MQYEALIKISNLRGDTEKFRNTDNSRGVKHYLIRALLAQISAKDAIKKNRNRVVEVLFIEFLQMHNVKVFVLIMKSALAIGKIKYFLK